NAKGNERAKARKGTVRTCEGGLVQGKRRARRSEGGDAGASPPLPFSAYARLHGALSVSSDRRGQKPEGLLQGPAGGSEKPPPPPARLLAATGHHENDQDHQKHEALEVVHGATPLSNRDGTVLASLFRCRNRPEEARTYNR